jgi:uncharacterized protein YcnI
MRSTAIPSLFVATTILFTAPDTLAHVSITSGVALADTTQEITFGVGHGCEGSDTRAVRIELPPEVLSVRALNGDLGPAEIELDDAGLVTAVTWEKPEEDVLEDDTHYYELVLRLKVPNTPFQTLYFPAFQTCQKSDGTLLEVGWVATPGDGDTELEPAPELRIVPKRYAGWNRFVVPSDVDDLAVYFADALIVWKDDAAYSVNPATLELIANTSGVSTLGSLAAGDSIWVRY